MLFEILQILHHHPPGRCPVVLLRHIFVYPFKHGMFPPLNAGIECLQVVHELGGFGGSCVWDLSIRMLVEIDRLTNKIDVAHTQVVLHFRFDNVEPWLILRSEFENVNELYPR